MIYLNSEFFIGKGAHKKCYIHPLSKFFCIKISYNNSEKIVEKEIKYNKFFQKKVSDSNIVPNYYGVIKTNLGNGYVYDLVRDYDGQISKPLDFYLKNKKLHPSLIKTFQTFEKQMIKNELITRKLKERNLLYQKFDKNCGQIVIVDDIGPNEFIPLEIWISFLAKMKIKRKINKFKKMIKKIYL
jgi:hypothetical protein